MAAHVTLVTGRAGSGKSRMLRARILAAGEAATLIVPEQFTFEAERALSEALGGGLMGVEVYSFTSLAQRVLAEAGERAVFLSAQGRRMVIRRVVEERKSALRVFAGVCERQGFCESMDDFFSLCARAEMTPTALAAAAEDLSGPLGDKLADLALLYEGVEAALAGRYMRDTDALALLAQKLPGSFLQARDLLVDNCDIWAAQIYGVLDALMAHARSLTLCVRADMDPACRDKQVFANEYRAYERLVAMARANGCIVERVDLPVKGAPWGEKRYASPALAHVEREIFAFPYQVFEGDPTGLTLFAATDAVAEAEAVADAVLRAVQSGMRYRDMAVVACDLPRYAAIVQRVFRRRNIPFFTDARQPLGQYGLPRLLLSALRCVTGGFGQTDVLALCKTGLAGVERDAAELFENQLLFSGARGQRLFSPFHGEALPAAAEEARRTLMEPLRELRDALRQADTAAGKTEALYAYMDALGVRGRIESLCEALREQGALGLMEENRQVYECVMELFSQLHAVMGDARLSNARFLALFTEGVRAYEIGVVPATADQVLFGSLDRTRARSLRGLFLLGAADGALPQSVRDDALIDDAELKRMAEKGLTPWDDSAIHAASARMDAYLALAKPSELLYVSYCTAEEQSPSAVVDRIRALFPTLVPQDDLTPAPPVDPEGGFRRLADSLRGYGEGGHAPDAGLLAWYAQDPAYAPRLARLETAIFPPSPAPLADAASIYPPMGSASRLETFNACPFKHFVQYGLRALPRREYRERRADEGSFCHEALSRYMRTLLVDTPDLAAMGQAEVDARLSFLPALLSTHNGGVLTDTARGRALGRRLTERVRATAYAVTQQLAAGRFRPLGSEVTFGRGGDLPPLPIPGADGKTYLLRGKIDRLDGFCDEGEAYYRVVDYKSGDTSLDFAQIYAGLRLQLPLYIAAATANERAVAAGMYYLPIDDPALEENEPPEALVKRFALSGITLADARVELASDAVQAGVLPPRAGRVERAAMERVTSYARRKSGETVTAMLRGDIEAAPCKRPDKTTACAYCDYGSVCRFDGSLPWCRRRTLEKMDAERFMEKTEP